MNIDTLDLILNLKLKKQITEEYEATHNDKIDEFKILSMIESRKSDIVDFILEKYKEYKKDCNL